MEKKLMLPVQNNESLEEFVIGQRILINGKMYIARDQAHKRIVNMLKNKEKLPFSLNGNMIYYCGPTPPRKDGTFGSAGPTTSARMDAYTIPLMKEGLKGFIGKGDRSGEIRLACKKYKSLYLITFGGAGAYLAKRIASQKLIAFPELGPEAIYEIEVIDFPAIVAFDTRGKSIFSTSAGFSNSPFLIELQ